jgi:hypothetical protein
MYCGLSETLSEAAPAAGVGPPRATSVGIRLGPSRRRPDVVTGEDGVAPTPLQVKYYAPDDQSDDWDENDQPNGHHDLLPEVFSAYASQANLGL